jgi:hypothetical protein
VPQARLTQAIDHAKESNQLAVVLSCFRHADFLVGLSALAAVIAAAAAGGSWQAAAFLLQHSPLHRQQWGDQAAVQTAVDVVLGRVAGGIASSGLKPEGQMLVLTSIHAAGVGVPEESRDE